MKLEVSHLEKKTLVIGRVRFILPLFQRTFRNNSNGKAFNYMSFTMTLSSNEARLLTFEVVKVKSTHWGQQPLYLNTLK